MLQDIDRKGIFLMPMGHAFAKHLIEDLEKVALQLGPTASEFLNGLVQGYEAAVEGGEGVLFESDGPPPGMEM